MRRAETGLSAALGLAALIVAGDAQAGYWTVPENYYAAEHIRFPMGGLSGDGFGTAYLNMAQRLSYAAFDASPTGMNPAQDSERGPVSSFAPLLTSRLAYRAPMVREAGNGDAASLSLWVKINPEDGDDMVLSSRGNVVCGYTLFTYAGQLRFLYWNALAGTANWIDQVGTVGALTPGAWHNIVITQSAKSAQFPGHVALYVDGVLESSTSNSPRASGLLGQSLGVASHTLVGSAALSGWIGSSAMPKRYDRDKDDRAKIDGVSPFARGMMSEYRYFGGVAFVCSDKTRDDYLDLNRRIQPGVRCSVASDVASMAQDRREQATLLARLPFAKDLDDHNFEGLNAANQIEPCGDCKSPTFAPDTVRQSVAAFDNSRVTYKTDTGPLAISNFSPPYSVAFWLKVPNEERPGSIFTTGEAEGAGSNISLADRRLYATAWSSGGKAVKSVHGAPMAPGWHHVAVSYEAAGHGGPVSGGLRLFVDGVFAREESLDTFQSISPISIGAPDPVRGTRAPGGQKISQTNFKGELSELQVAKAPITLPQARALASRYPNAYKPSVKKTAFEYRLDPISPKQKGYIYENSVVTKPNPFSGSKNAQDSVSLAFTMDWGKPSDRWRDTAGEVTEDCEFVLGGVRLFDAPDDLDASAPSSALLCFSPTKIARNMPPFSLGLYYKKYEKHFYLTINESLMLKYQLANLLVYSERGVPGLSTDFDLNIGRYNIILQAQTKDTRGSGISVGPNYISPVYQGADALVTAAFRVGQDNVPTFIRSVATGLMTQAYVDQRQLMDDLDVKFSKDR